MLMFSGGSAAKDEDFDAVVDAVGGGNALHAKNVGAAKPARVVMLVRSELESFARAPTDRLNALPLAIAPMRFAGRGAGLEMIDRRAEAAHITRAVLDATERELGEQVFEAAAPYIAVTMLEAMEARIAKGAKARPSKTDESRAPASPIGVAKSRSSERLERAVALDGQINAPP